MTKIQALKTAVAYMLCEQIADCRKCYLGTTDCEKAAVEASGIIKDILADEGFPFPGTEVRSDG